MHNKFHLEY